PAIKIIGVEPASSNHKLPGMKRITGLAEEFIPKILDYSVIDETIGVADEDAYGTAIDLARRDGIPVGPTTGAILYAALRYAESRPGLAVVISPDDAFKYASFYKDVLEREAEASRREGNDYRI
ncbi:MAG: cysteine synthase A, partial [Chloroflexi bacterium]|nr:cysteine synthase A [Chloroflexota bacterium]